MVLLTPELSLVGYPPEDLLLRGAFYAATEASLAELVAQSLRFPGLHLVVGHPHQVNGQRFNAASVICDGRILGTYHKRELPNYGVFDEPRYFDSGHEPFVFEVAGLPIGLLICEDFWFPHAARAARAAGARLLLAPNASPFHLDKQSDRLRVVRENISAQGLPIVLSSLVGGQDELVFDGRSFAVNADGALAAQSPGFVEDLLLVEVDEQGGLRGPVSPDPGREEEDRKSVV